MMFDIEKDNVPWFAFLFLNSFIVRISMVSDFLDVIPHYFIHYIVAQFSLNFISTT